MTDTGGDVIHRAATVAKQEESAVVSALLTSLALLASLLIGRWATTRRCVFALAKPVSLAGQGATHATGPSFAIHRTHIHGCGVASLLGLAMGVAVLVFSWVRSSGDARGLPLRLSFDGASFFTYLLPPIIFDAGLRVNTREFFDNTRFPYICLLGVAVTLSSCAVVAAVVNFTLKAYAMPLKSQLAMGAVFAATDTVATLATLDVGSAPRLFSIVLGEGCINDAMSLVLLRTVESLPTNGGATSWSVALQLLILFSWLLASSIALGVVVGLASALLARIIVSHAHSDDRSGGHISLETALSYLLAYLSYLLAEAFHLSGILSLFACSLAMSHYTLRALSKQAREATLHLSSTLAFVCEQLTFLQSGMAVVDMRIWRLAHGLEVFALLTTLGAALLLTRAGTVFPALALGNAISRKAGDAAPLSWRESTVVFWAGSMRGAVSIAIAWHFFDIRSTDGEDSDETRTNASVIAAALLIVLISSTVFSGMTRPLLQRLLPAAVVGSAPQPRPVGSLLDAGIVCDGSTTCDGDNSDDAWLARTWRRIDERFLAPVLCGPPTSGAGQQRHIAYTELPNRHGGAVDNFAPGS